MRSVSFLFFAVLSSAALAAIPSGVFQSVHGDQISIDEPGVVTVKGGTDIHKLACGGRLVAATHADRFTISCSFGNCAFPAKLEVGLFPNDDILTVDETYPELMQPANCYHLGSLTSESIWKRLK